MGKVHTDSLQCISVRFVEVYLGEVRLLDQQHLQCCPFQNWGVGTWHSTEKAPHFNFWGGIFEENKSKWGA